MQPRARNAVQMPVKAAADAAFGHGRRQLFAGDAAVAERVVQEGENLAAVLLLQLFRRLKGQAVASGLALDDLVVLGRVGAVDILIVLLPK